MRVETGFDRGRGTRTRRFVLHALEMVAAMLLGMVVLGMAFRGIHLALFGTGFDEAWHRHTALAVFAMTFNMTLPMVVWMPHRGHSWERSAEMGAAMFVLAIALLAAFWLGVISAHVVLPLEMALMIPAMVLVMLYRVDDYSEPHPAKGAAAPPHLGAGARTMVGPDAAQTGTHGSAPVGGGTHGSLRGHARPVRRARRQPWGPAGGSRDA